MNYIVNYAVGSMLCAYIFGFITGCLVETYYRDSMNLQKKANKNNESR